MEQDLTLRTLTEEETMLLVSGGCKSCTNNGGTGGFGAIASESDFEKFMAAHHE
ncbi:hypothetical protein [Serratia quinivorans]|uniref:hypothetical protein n=1 Tax=Serratia quinivorans TaxID=137545 RepID=UPI00217BA452|nr:hypothetical protein [Serratia quinivorans]CAI0943646.1 Uncharacterised protein [Serratia quinivorans]CAI1739430.1 Uncharacterised protein [Serratia quinivorans]